ANRRVWAPPFPATATPPRPTRCGQSRPTPGRTRRRGRVPSLAATTPPAPPPKDLAPAGLSRPAHRGPAGLLRGQVGRDTRDSAPVSTPRSRAAGKECDGAISDFGFRISDWRCLNKATIPPPAVRVRPGAGEWHPSLPLRNLRSKDASAPCAPWPRVG